MPSTCDITRQDAQQAILGKVMTATDAELCDAMCALHGQGGLNNFGIVPCYREADPYSDQCPHSTYEWDHAAQGPVHPFSGPPAFRYDD